MGERYSRMAFKHSLLRVHREQRMPPANFGFSIAARRNFFDTIHKSQEQGVEHKALSRSRFRAQSQISRAACMERTPSISLIQGQVSGADIAPKDNSQVPVF